MSSCLVAGKPHVTVVRLSSSIAAMHAAVRPTRPSLSCVVPAYNEADNLPLLLEQLTAQLKALTDAWEVIVVDDGSTDATVQVMQPWTATPGVRFLQLSRNFGKEA